MRAQFVPARPLEMPVLGLGGDQRFGARMVPMLQEFAGDVTGGSIARCGHYVADEGSVVIKRLGLLNDRVQEHHAFYGVPIRDDVYGVPNTWW